MTSVWSQLLGALVGIVLAAKITVLTMLREVHEASEDSKKDLERALEGYMNDLRQIGLPEKNGPDPELTPENISYYLGKVHIRLTETYPPYSISRETLASYNYYVSNRLVEENLEKTSGRTQQYLSFLLKYSGAEYWRTLEATIASKQKTEKRTIQLRWFDNTISLIALGSLIPVAACVVAASLETAMLDWVSTLMNSLSYLVMIVIATLVTSLGLPTNDSRITLRYYGPLHIIVLVLLFASVVVIGLDNARIIKDPPTMPGQAGVENTGEPTCVHRTQSEERYPRQTRVCADTAANSPAPWSLLRDSSAIKK